MSPVHRTFEVPRTDARSVWPLAAMSGLDPTARRVGDALWKTWRTPAGPATLGVELDGTEARAWAWGPGAEHALSRVPAICGAHDDPAGFVPGHPNVVALALRWPHLRLAALPWTVDALLQAVLQQRVRFDDAAKSWRDLVYAWGEPAPGPWDDGDDRLVPLRLAPDPARLARVDPRALRPFDVDGQRAATLTEVAFRARHVAALADAPDPAPAVLAALRGVGPWTSAHFLGLTLGDPDAVPTGDVHLPRLVSTLLTGDERADDARMLQLLAPWSGHRHRVIRLLLMQGGRRLR